MSSLVIRRGSIEPLPEFNHEYSIDRDFDTPWIKHDPKDYDIPVVQSLEPSNAIQQGSGSGLDGTQPFLFAAEVLRNAKEYLGTLDTLVFGPIGTSISNVASEYLNKNPEWKPGFAGEKHLILPTEYGLTRANYAGPGTRLDVRIPRGDKGVDGPFGIDNAAMKHDLDYLAAKTPKDIRQADDKFIRRVSNSTQAPAVKSMVVGAMQAKKFGEDFGIFDRNKYLGKGHSQKKPIDYDEDDDEVPQKNRKKKKVYPAEMLRKYIGKKKKN